MRAITLFVAEDVPSAETVSFYLAVFVDFVLSGARWGCPVCYVEE